MEPDRKITLQDTKTVLGHLGDQKEILMLAQWLTALVKANDDRRRIFTLSCRAVVEGERTNVEMEWPVLLEKDNGNADVLQVAVQQLLAEGAQPIRP